MPKQPDAVIIERRFRGPPESGNGGYSCGLLGVTLGASAEVSLRLPPPLQTPLRIEDGRLLDGERVIAEGTPASLDVQPPPPPSVQQARAASRPYDRHPFPECFACGHERAPGDGLRIYGSAVEGHEGIAALWEPEHEVAPEVVWAALDCLTGWACRLGGPSVLARLAVRIDAPVLAGPHVLHAWPTARDGRKHFADEALYDGEGRLLAVARALWIELRDPSAFQARV